MTVCRLILSQPQSGVANMSLDEALLECAGEGAATLRIYQWSQPTLSLGYFQRAADRQQHEASLQCAAVRRPSGGGAIVHDRELTYCLILPASLAASQPHVHWYFSVHRAILAVLRKVCCHRGAAPAADAQMAAEPPTRCDAAGESRNQAFLCFQRRCVGDVLLGGHKVAGSAQRRRGGAILQHGSVLLMRSPHAPELPGIADLAGRETQFASFAEDLVEALAEAFEFEFRAEGVAPAEHAAAARLALAKYGSRSWTERR